MRGTGFGIIEGTDSYSRIRIGKAVLDLENRETGREKTILVPVQPCPWIPLGTLVTFSVSFPI